MEPAMPATITTIMLKEITASTMTIGAIKALPRFHPSRRRRGSHKAASAYLICRLAFGTALGTWCSSDVRRNSTLSRGGHPGSDRATGAMPTCNSPTRPCETRACSDMRRGSQKPWAWWAEEGEEEERHREIAMGRGGAQDEDGDGDCGYDEDESSRVMVPSARSPRVLPSILRHLVFSHVGRRWLCRRPQIRMGRESICDLAQGCTFCKRRKEIRHPCCFGAPVVVVVKETGGRRVRFRRIARVGSMTIAYCSLSLVTTSIHVRVPCWTFSHGSRARHRNVGELIGLGLGL
ncbi:uncharacterized protein EV422DRAFT_228503 [Fimicolochytrium jonesii]|uniref:uncharacterized protein n=1 Tax=Fimicolochytrium jonesii TaxID=1396493 RepID=UPI0022FF38F7|nr:uncharacterized protein EV422DRAFT_228503 [Fimicolochytrium jonesii]KAI8817245.1 hypothetical protein EV422DRAFT_228503 [Fimicolochytrium jonesii]